LNPLSKDSMVCLLRWLIFRPRLYRMRSAVWAAAVREILMSSLAYPPPRIQPARDIG